MTAFIIIFSVIMLFFLFFIQWLKIYVSYDDKISVRAAIGPFSFDFKKLGKKDKKKKKGNKKKAEDRKDENAENKKPAYKKNKKEELSVLFELLKIAKEMLPVFLGKLHFYAGKLYVSIGCDDAATTAISCAAAKAAISLLFEVIDTYSVIDRGTVKNVKTEPDFLSGKTTFDIDLRFRIRIWSCFILGIKIIFKFIKKKINDEKKSTEET